MNSRAKPISGSELIRDVHHVSKLDHSMAVGRLSRYYGEYVALLLSGVEKHVEHVGLSKEMDSALARLTAGLDTIDDSVRDDLVHRITALRGSKTRFCRDKALADTVSGLPAAAKNALELLFRLSELDRGPSSGHDAWEHEAVRAVLEGPTELQIAFVGVVLDLCSQLCVQMGHLTEDSADEYMNLPLQEGYPTTGMMVAERLIRKKLPFCESDYVYMFSRLADLKVLTTDAVPVLTPLIGLVERFVAEHDAGADLGHALGGVYEALTWVSNSPETKLRARILRMGDASVIPLYSGEAWSDAAIAELNTLNAAEQAAWVELLDHCLNASGGKPSKKWQKIAQEKLDAVTGERLRGCLLEWFPLVDRPRTDAADAGWQWGEHGDQMIVDPHADILKGLAWCCERFDDREVACALSALAVSAYRKVPGVGPRAVKIGNACVYALGVMGGTEGVGQLALLKVKVRFRTARKGIDASLTRAAERLGILPDELEEMAVPAYGLIEVGRLTEQMGEFTAEVTVAGTRSTQLSWIKADGKRRKSVPAAVKSDFAEELKSLKATVKDIAKMLPAQSERIDNLCLQERTWPLELWRQRYLDHPLVGTIARRLIWEFTTDSQAADGIYLDGQLVGLDDVPLTGLGAETVVRIWHPIGRAAELIVAWRNWLENHQISQPFKQAHREVYLLTDAERHTRVYSNRYAAHIVRQHQFNALCAARGWKNTLKLLVDDEFPPASLELPQWDLRAEFWTEGAGDEHGTHTNDAGTYHYLATDQVRFYRLGTPQTTAHGYGGRADQPADSILLEDISPLVFSEVMRDIDLFVGVASVGNNPEWVDGGPDGAYRDYWHSYSFGELSGTARTRRDVLKQLIPRLKIADRCTLEERFLVVRGDIRTYRIHLGSGNILMSPNDQYLCIVRASSTAAPKKLFLPFEGDERLAVILSKAFLLAEDTKITDTIIVEQISG